VTLRDALQLAAEHQRAGRWQEAEAIYQQVLAAQPDHADALFSYGLLAMTVGRPDAAAELLRRAATLAPNAADVHLNLGAALQNLGRGEEAMAAYRRGLELRPGHAQALNNLAILLRDRGRLEEAVVHYRLALQSDRLLAAAWNNLGAALRELGRVEEALPIYEQALALDPRAPIAYNNLAVALRELGRGEEAIAACRQAHEIDPAYAEAHFTRGRVHLDRSELEAAVRAFQRALELQPGYVEALNYLGEALKEQGRVGEALAAYRAALQQRADAQVLSNYLAVLQYAEGITPAALQAAHAQYESQFGAPLTGLRRNHSLDSRADRPLRIAFISPNFAAHPVGSFFVRALEQFNREKLTAICYSDRTRPDAMTARLRAAAAEWHESRGWSDEELSERVRANRVDILFDLAGHTAGNRLGVFARKPAPIQVTWLDYVGTTGVGAMDYIVADPHEIPPGAEQWYWERVLRMPDDYICFDPPAHAPAVGPLPALGNGVITFGSFNIPAKISARALDAWAQILSQVPGSRLVLKNRGLDDPGTAARFYQALAERGIAAERVELRGWSPPAELLAAYGRIDVALDTFPYNGGLTTCEALWMGVPVVTFPGETFAGRHGLAHLSAAGVHETIARNAAEYVEVAVTLARDVERLAALRAGLRSRVAASPLCDGARFARHFEGLMREVWERAVSAEAKTRQP
jgi:predicted O-linked N-acetylglucosamine transferase (SPINDLY family)